LAGYLDGSLFGVDIDNPIAGEELLGFREGPVGDYWWAAGLRLDYLCLLGSGQTLGVD
jgi:hypothetical protein